MLSILFPLVNKLDGEANRNEMQDYSACMKHDDGMHAHSSRRTPHVRMGKGDNSDCVSWFKHGPRNQSKHTWDTDLKKLSLKGDHTKLICHHMAILLFLKSNINFLIMSDKSARQTNNSEEEHLSCKQMV